MVNTILSKYDELFDRKPIIIRAPGRINLIGEHTDYNDGFVMPASVDKEIIFALSSNNTKYCNLYSYNFKQHYKLDLSALEKSDLGWPNYFSGIAEVLQDNDMIPGGVDCVFGGNIPTGAGMSSSAALESGFIFGLNTLFQFGLTRKQMAVMAQKAENDFVGVNCGIMDQYASLLGVENKILKLDCRSLETEYVNFNLPGHSFVLVDSKVKHSLASSEYNIRREECETGIAIIKKDNKHISSLRDINVDLLRKYQYAMKENVYKRCLYVVEENQRVRDAIIALNNGDKRSLRNLMFRTHVGLKLKYEVSCDELDFLVDNARGIPGVFGSRLMGGGFGGCTINIVEDKAIEHFTNTICGLYLHEFGKETETYTVKIVDGVSQL